MLQNAKFVLTSHNPSGTFSNSVLILKFRTMKVDTGSKVNYDMSKKSEEKL